MTFDQIAANLAHVRSRIDAAARRAGRNPAEITLIAVSKTFDAEHVRAAWAAGQRDFGENKVQEAQQKIARNGRPAGARWHLIGHLQSNKARKAAAPFACIHSVDSVDLLQTARRGGRGSRGASRKSCCRRTWPAKPPNSGQRAGCRSRSPVPRLESRAVKLAGLMLLPPWNDNQEHTRPWFARLRQLRDRLIAEGIPAESLRHLSMGMSHDFEAAIEEGATLVRVGTAIFGKRTTV